MFNKITMIIVMALCVSCAPSPRNANFNTDNSDKTSDITINIDTYKLTGNIVIDESKKKKNKWYTERTNAKIQRKELQEIINTISTNLSSYFTKVNINSDDTNKDTLR